MTTTVLPFLGRGLCSRAKMTCQWPKKRSREFCVCLYRLKGSQDKVICCCNLSACCCALSALGWMDLLLQLIPAWLETGIPWPNQTTQRDSRPGPWRERGAQHVKPLFQLLSLAFGIPVWKHLTVYLTEISRHANCAFLSLFFFHLHGHTLHLPTALAEHFFMQIPTIHCLTSYVSKLRV